MLILTGLPTLFPKLVAARTYTERMFHLVFLHALTKQQTEQAIRTPIERSNCPIQIQDDSLKTIWEITRDTRTSSNTSAEKRSMCGSRLFRRECLPRASQFWK